jgi:hypothetical protein
MKRADMEWIKPKKIVNDDKVRGAMRDTEEPIAPGTAGRVEVGRG